MVIIFRFLICIIILIPLVLFSYRYYKKKTNIEGETSLSELEKGVKNKLIFRTFLGLIIFITGLVLTSISRGNVLFYGAILGGLFMFLGGIFGLFRIRS